MKKTPLRQSGHIKSLALRPGILHRMEQAKEFYPLKLEDLNSLAATSYTGPIIAPLTTITRKPPPIDISNKKVVTLESFYYQIKIKSTLMACFLVSAHFTILYFLLDQISNDESLKDARQRYFPILLCLQILMVMASMLEHKGDSWLLLRYQRWRIFNIKDFIFRKISKYLVGFLILFIVWEFLFYKDVFMTENQKFGARIEFLILILWTCSGHYKLDSEKNQFFVKMDIANYGNIDALTYEKIKKIILKLSLEMILIAITLNIGIMGITIIFKNLNIFSLLYCIGQKDITCVKNLFKCKELLINIFHSLLNNFSMESMIQTAINFHLINFSVSISTLYYQYLSEIYFENDFFEFVSGLEKDQILVIDVNSLRKKPVGMLIRWQKSLFSMKINFLKRHKNKIIIINHNNKGSYINKEVLLEFLYSIVYLSDKKMNSVIDSYRNYMRSKDRSDFRYLRDFQCLLLRRELLDAVVEELFYIDYLVIKLRSYLEVTSIQLQDGSVLSTTFVLKFKNLDINDTIQRYRRELRNLPWNIDNKFTHSIEMNILGMSKYSQLIERIGIKIKIMENYFSKYC